MSICNTKRALALRRLLPEFIRSELDNEQTEWKKQLFIRLPESIKNNDYQEIDFWFIQIDTYLTLETFTFTPKEIENLAKLIYNFILTSEDYNLIVTAITIFVTIVDPMFIKIDLEVDWKPLFHLFYDSTLTHSKTKIRKYPPNFQDSIISMIRVSRSYFSENAIDEMINEWWHMLDPHQPSFILGHCLFCLFIPVFRGQHNKWVSKFFDLWNLMRSEHYDFQFLSLFARLSRYYFDDIPWDDILPFIFNIACNYIGAPGSLLQNSIPQVVNYHPELYASFFKDCTSLTNILALFAMIAVNLLTGPTKELTRSYIEKMLHIIQPFCTPILHSEDESQCEAPIEVINVLTQEYVRRYKQEQKYGSKFEMLTTDDNEWFVSKILPLVITEIFHENPQFGSFNFISQLCPHLVIPPVMNAIKHALEYLHLKQCAYQTLSSIAPIIIYTKIGLIDMMSIIEHNVHEDINFMDTDRTSLMFVILSIISTSMSFTDEHENMLLTITQSCITFCEHAIGEDYELMLSELLSTIGQIIRASPSHIAKKMAIKVRNGMKDIPESSLSYLIEALDDYSPKVFGDIALNAKDIKSYVILNAILRQSDSFIKNNFEKIKEKLTEGINHDEKKIKHNAINSLKWVLKNLITCHVRLPTNQGIVSTEKVKVIWHIPSDDEIKKADDLINHFYNIMVEKLNSNDRQKINIATRIGRVMLKGVIGITSEKYFEPIEDKRFIQPPLKRFSSEKMTMHLKKITDTLVDFLYQHENVHTKAIVSIFKAVTITFFPRDSNATSIDTISNEYHANSQITRLNPHLPSLESSTYIMHFWKALSMFANRQACTIVTFTKYFESLFPRLMRIKHNNDPLIRTEMNQISQKIIQMYQTPSPQIFYDIINNAIENINPESETNLELLAMHCNVASNLNLLPINIETMKVMAAAAMSTCVQLPPDVPDDAARSLRQGIVILLDQLDPGDPRLPTDEYYAIRQKLAHDAMERHAKYPTSRETQNYAVAIVCAVISGLPMLLQPNVFSFISSNITTDDQLVRECVIQMLPSMIEYLIPRVNRPPGIDVEEVTPENYDMAAFIDRPFKKPAKKQPHFLTYEEMTDKSILKQYFSDGIEDRIEIHKILFEKVFDMKVIREFIDNLVNAQVHKEENFSKLRVLFWGTLSRFFGIDFIKQIFEEFDALTNTAATIAQHVIAAEIFAGCLHSLKSRSYAEVEKVSYFVKPFVSHLLKVCDPEFHSIWYFSFYASFTDYDPRRIFWLYDFIITCVPNNDSIRAAKVVSLITDILLDVVYNIPALKSKIEEMAATSLFSESALQFEQVRECSVRALSLILGLTFDLDTRGRNPESIRILDRFVTNSSDIFVARWALAQFSTQSISTLAAGGYAIDHLDKWVDIILDKDENEEKIARASLMGVAASNWLGSVCQRPITLKTVEDLIGEMLKSLSPAGKTWQVMTVQLLLTESFLASVFFYVDEATLEGLIGDRVIPALLHPHPDVQDSGSQLLTFVVKSSLQLSEKLPFIIEIFKKMLTDPESKSRRIAGAKGLYSIISGTVLFDDVPQYVIDTFSALTEAVEVDNTVEPVISQFLSDFWAMYDNNLMKNIADTLQPFHLYMRPSYFC